MQTMPATPIVCFGCGQTGHMKRECPHGGTYTGRGGARPAGPGRGRGGYQSRGGYNQSRGMDRGRMTCFKCLNKFHSVHECTVSDNKIETVHQKNLEIILTARGMPAVNSTQEDYRGPAAANFMAGNSDMQAALRI